MRIGILTGGGDVPGLNPCIKSVVYRAIDDGADVIGIRRGWAGLLKYNIDDPSEADECIIPLNKANTRVIDRSGGTFLHTSRTNPGKVKWSEVPDFLKEPDNPPKEGDLPYDFTPHILKVLEHLGIDVLIPIGGDDTLSYGVRLHKEGFPVVAIPKTMDNDVFGTDYCIGFSTAVTRSTHFITALRTPAGSHERIAIVELFGRNSGETSLITAYLAGVDRAIISEVAFDPEKLAGFLMQDKKENPSNYAIMTISEGAQMVGGKIIEYGQEDAYGHKKLGGIGEITGEAIEKITGSHIIYQPLAYLMRSGEPDALDRMVAISYANLATDLAVRGDYGHLVALREGKYTTVPIMTMTQGKKHVDVDELYDVDQYRPKIYRMLGKPMFLY
ncbi:MAG: phosphofructokinase [Ignavibacteriales bacterium CG07_land_8_20_14_0_80_59_12]|nr:MAG: phosphofructokinase [Ignavibacteriales bacterium CG07_land_8_20_14_0_80_59_12]